MITSDTENMNGKKIVVEEERQFFIIMFLMFCKIPQLVLARDQPHIGIGFINIIIKINLLVELINLPDLLKQSGMCD